MKELTAIVVRQLAAGKSQELVSQQLIARGWPEISARHFVSNAAPTASEHNAVDNPEEREVMVEVYRRRMIRDLIMIVASLVLMLVVVKLFPEYGVLALFLLGMTALSTIDFIVALWGWSRNRS